jgi:KUP system potassium uptake protein
MLGALGVVFGDIGTSPLYALRSVLGEADRPDRATVLGMTSLVIWALVLVVTVLYVGLLLREDNDGEGGLLALLALLRGSLRSGRGLAWAGLLGMAGAAMFLGDSIVTPAISVLSASEGLEVASPALSPWVVPVALVLLVGVFVLQRVGSGSIGRFYGPVMVVWFVVLGGGGVVALTRDLSAAQAISPVWAARFVATDPMTAFLSLGSVILVVTGAEALYADLGHFGRSAITRTWLLLVLPALLLAYLGECAQILTDPSAAADPFYAVVPSWGRIPVLVVASAATVIASEAVIAGAFTVLHQAGGLGLFPYLRTRHTSRRHGGQIYLPAANWTLAAAVLAVVLMFRSSERLASAYGVAVSTTILSTVSLYLLLGQARRPRRLVRQAVAVVMFLVMLCFVAAAVPKLASGGWLPTGVGLVLCVVMTTWATGQRRLRDTRRRTADASTRKLLHHLRISGDRSVQTLPGCTVFLTDDLQVAPVALQTMGEQWHVVPERAVLLSWRVEDSPTASPEGAAIEVEHFGGGDGADGVVGIDVALGYRERLDVRHVLSEARDHAPEELAQVDPDSVRFVVSDEIPRISRRCGMAVWRQRLFLVLDRLATDRVEQLELPRDRTVLVGRELSL